jgi:hypothetical protein
VNLSFGKGPWTYQGHFSANDLPKLGDLIDGILSTQKGDAARDSGVLRRLRLIE